MFNMAKNCCATFDQPYGGYLINGTDLTWENRPLCVTSPLFQPPPSSPRLSLVCCPPILCRTNGTDVVGQDSTPWSPSLHYSPSMRSETCVLIIAPPPPELFPPQEKKRPKEEGDWETKSSQIKEGGKRKRSTQPCLRNIKNKHTSWQPPNNKLCDSQCAVRERKFWSQTVGG